MLEVTSVDKGSVGEELGFEQGDKLLSFNGEPFEDILDYFYLDGQEKFSLKVLTNQGKKVTCKVEKTASESLGLNFDGEELTPKRCANKCIFCFVDQLPKGMRDTLYVKDDDWRCSFVSGNYVTLTNVHENEIERIIARQFSPLYISVHATDSAVRGKMLGRKNGADIMSVLKRFADSGIVMHTQIVLVKGVNDGAVLTKTLQDLDSLYPAIRSVSVVPVGLTCHREKLFNIETIDKDTAKDAIDITERINGSRSWCFCADEMYLKAGKPTRHNAYYGDNPQYENGVGMLARFEAEVKTFSKGTELAGNFGIITGFAAADMFNKIAKQLQETNKDLNISVYPIPNNFFGRSITVSGLVTGQDIIKELSGKVLPPKLLMPRVMFKEFETVMLDGMTVETLKESLGTDLEIIDTNGEKFIQAVTKL